MLTIFLVTHLHYRSSELRAFFIFLFPWVVSFGVKEEKKKKVSGSVWSLRFWLASFSKSVICSLEGTLANQSARRHLQSQELLIVHVSYLVRALIWEFSCRPNWRAGCEVVCQSVSHLVCSLKSEPSWQRKPKRVCKLSTADKQKILLEINTEVKLGSHRSSQSALSLQTRLRFMLSARVRLKWQPRTHSKETLNPEFTSSPDLNDYKIFRFSPHVPLDGIVIYFLSSSVHKERSLMF